jgi:hypothetical protein
MMDQPAVVAAISVVGTVVVLLLLGFLLAGFDGRRFGLGFSALMRTLRDAAFANQVEPLLTPPAAAAPTVPKFSGVPVRLLAVLQREGRLLDFLLEDIQTYPDAQIGAAVKDIHRKCHAAIKEHLVLEPVMTQSEGATVEVPAGFDPSAVRVTGNVTGNPPYRGTLQHHGWRVKELKLAAPPEGQDERILMPAEVEVQ